MPLYVADYLADTGHLSTIEHGAYMLLIMHYWQKGGLPDDDKRLASIARTSPEQCAQIRETLAEFFGDGWKHARIDEELDKSKKAYERRASAGRAGGKAKAAAQQGSGNAIAGPKQSQPQPHREAAPDGAASSSPRKDELDVLRGRLVEAVGEGNIQPHGALDLSPVLGLAAAGVDLETDILPTIRARAARLKRPAGSWAYFVEPIREAYRRRIEAGEGLARPKVASTRRDEDRSPEEMKRHWRGRLELCRNRSQDWLSDAWGPMPGRPGCRVPDALLKSGDGEGWREWNPDAA